MQKVNPFKSTSQVSAAGFQQYEMFWPTGRRHSPAGLPTGLQGSVFRVAGPGEGLRLQSGDCDSKTLGGRENVEVGQTLVAVTSSWCACAAESRRAQGGDAESQPIQVVRSGNVPHW